MYPAQLIIYENNSDREDLVAIHRNPIFFGYRVGYQVLNPIPENPILSGIKLEPEPGKPGFFRVLKIKNKLFNIENMIFDYYKYFFTNVLKKNIFINKQKIFI